jgi:hypothetical protein
MIHGDGWGGYFQSFSTSRGSFRMSVFGARTALALPRFEVWSHGAMHAAGWQARGLERMLAGDPAWDGRFAMATDGLGFGAVVLRTDLRASVERLAGLESITVRLGGASVSAIAGGGVGIAAGGPFAEACRELVDRGVRIARRPSWSTRPSCAGCGGGPRARGTPRRAGVAGSLRPSIFAAPRCAAAVARSRRPSRVRARRRSRSTWRAWDRRRRCRS